MLSSVWMLLSAFAMTTTDLLRANCERLLSQYFSNLQAVLALQDSLIHDILPLIVDELSLSAEAKDWAREWLEDTATIFRIFRRNGFTNSSARESIRKILIWRLNNLWPSDRLMSIPMMHCLPQTAHDPFGRPILLIQVPLDATDDPPQSLILQAFERSRAYLQRLNETAVDSPILQYVLLLDLKGVSLSTINKDVIAWTLREVIPRFPGMLAGVFMLNFSWIHTGMWNVIRHVLPSSALSRVFFPSSDELLQYFTPQFLPKDYGGTLPHLIQLDDPLMAPPLQHRQLVPRKTIGTSHSKEISRRLSISLAPTSLSNPYFGYPASSFDGSLSLQHGRRRRRDLARTLAGLYWMRWGNALIMSIVVFMTCALGLAGGRRQKVQTALSQAAICILQIHSK